MSYDQHILVKNPEIIPKLTEVLGLLFKKTRSGISPQDGYNFKKSSFDKSPCLGKRSASLMNECLLNHRFDEAAKLLWIMSQDRRCFDLVLYKGIMVVLENLFSSNDLQTVKAVSSDIRKMRFVNKLEIQLEYLIYALRNDINGAEDSFYLEGKTAVKRTMKIIPLLEHLYSAYSTLINYIKWFNISQYEPSSQDNKNFAFTIINSFKQLIKEPGIWDIFVLKLIEMLEYYEQYEEIKEILMKYVELNPEHINAYIYLCVHLHKHNSDPEIFIQYAMALCNLCPSDERVLLLVQKYNELGINLKKCLKILFMFLDYPVNGTKLLAWQFLSLCLHKTRKSSELKLVNSSWSLRCSSWNYMHFKSSNICTEAFELISWKTKMLSFVDPYHEYINLAHEKFSSINEEHLLQNEISLLKSENFMSLYDLNDDASR